MEPANQAEIDALKKAADSVKLPVTPQLAENIVEKVKKHGVSSSEVTTYINQMFHSNQRREKIWKILQDVFSENSTSELRSSVKKITSQDTVSNALKKLLNYLSQNFMMENDKVLKLISDALLKNDFSELNDFTVPKERPKQIEAITKLIKNCIGLLEKSGQLPKNTDPAQILLDKMNEIIQQSKKRKGSKGQDQLEMDMEAEMERLQGINRIKSHDVWKKKQVTDKNKEAERIAEADRAFETYFPQQNKQPMIKSFLIDQKGNKEGQQKKFGAKNRDFMEKNKNRNQEKGARGQSNECTIVFCMVLKSPIQYRNLGVFHEFGPQQFRDYSQRISDVRQFYTNNTFHYVFTLTAPISSNNQKQNFIIEVNFIRFVSQTHYEVIDQKRIRREVELFKQKGFDIMTPNLLRPIQHNRVMFLMLIGLMDKSGGGRRRGHLMDIDEEFMGGFHRQIQGFEDPESVFDWLYIFAERIFNKSMRGDEEIVNCIAQLPQLGDKCAKYFIFLMLYLFEEKTQNLLIFSNYMTRLDFPFQYRRNTINAYHEYLENEYILLGLRLLLLRMKNKQYHFSNNVIAMLNANLQFQIPELRKIVLLQTLQKQPHLLGQSYMVTDFLKHSQLISPLQYFNVATHYFRLQQVHAQNNTSEIDNSTSIIKLLDDILNKFTEQRRKLNRTKSINESIRSISMKSSTCQIEQYPEGVELMFVLRYHYNKQGPCFGLQGQYLVKAMRILRALEKVNNYIPNRIYTATKKYFDEAVYDCLAAFPSEILPFLSLVPIHERQLKYVQNHFKQTDIIWPTKTFKEIFDRVLVYKKQRDPYDINYVIQKVSKIISYHTYDSFVLMQSLNDTLKNVKSQEQGEVFLKFLNKTLDKTDFIGENYLNHTVQYILKVLKFQQSLKVSTMIKLCAYIKKFTPNIERDQLISRLTTYDIQESDLQLIVENMYLGQVVTEQEQLRQCWQAMKKNPKLLKAYEKKYYKTNYKQILQKICLKIENQHLLKDQFQQIFRNKQQIDSLVKKYCDFLEKLQKLKEILDTVLYRLENVLRILREHMNNWNFQPQINEVTHHKETILSKQLRQALVVPKKYVKIFQSSREVLVLINLEIWRKDKIKNIDSILNVRDQTVQNLRQSMTKFKNRTILFDEFYLKFPEQYLEQILKYTTDTVLKDQFRVASKKTNLKWLEEFQQYAISFDFLKNRVEKSIFDFEQFYGMMKQLHKKQWQINVKEMLRIIDHANGIFIDHGIKVCEKSDEIGRTVFRSGLCREMFKYIQEQNLDYKKISDLKQYINDLENSILRLETVKDFESVVLYWQIVMQNNNIKKLLQNLRRQVLDKNWILSESIQNSFVNLKLIEQKVDQSANRQTSFKYEIEKIFLKSKFIMKRKDDTIEIKIKLLTEGEIQERPDLTEAEKRILINSIIDYKKIILYKEKSILLINDFEREKSNIDEKAQNIINVLKQYFDLFKIIEQIERGAEILIKYGFDPESLNKIGQIKNHNYDQVKQIASFISQVSETWKQQIKELHENSYLFTHFLGPELNFFIEQTLKKNYHPSLQWIIGMNKQQFEDHMNTLAVRGIIKSSNISSPLDRIKLVDNIFENYRKVPKRPKQFQKARQRQPTITLITCRQSQFYCALFDTDDKPEINQILYCQLQTKPEEIQVFINRARLNPGKKHFILAVHNLNVELQLYFCDLLNKYFIDEKDHNGAKLCFIDYSTNEKVFLHLCRPNLFDIDRITMNEIQMKRRSKAIADLSGNTYIIESDKPGMGKTFRAKKLAQQYSNGVLHYFPLAGNISFTTLAKRLNEIDFSNKDTLLIQIGHVENKSKLQVFLYEMIMFRCFNYRKFMFFPKKMQIVVELQCIFDLKKDEQYHIIKFLKDHGKDKYITLNEFDVEAIQITQHDFRDIFVIVYLDMMSSAMILRREIKYKKQELKINLKYRESIKQYFLAKLQQKGAKPTYAMYRKWMDMLYSAFYTFSETGSLSPAGMRECHIAFPGLGFDKVRLKFLNICINNCLQFLLETITTNSFDAKEGDQEDFRQKLSQFPFLILPSRDCGSYQFIYTKQDQVPFQIKTLVLSQEYKYRKQIQTARGNKKTIDKLFDEKALYKLTGQALQQQMFDILQVISGNNKLAGNIKSIKERNPNIKRYSLTLDNFFKMCLIFQRYLCGVPIVIMGQSGVGKTALITFLTEIVLEDQLHCLNVHAGIGENQINNWVNMFKDKAANAPAGKKVWIFFDQFNTTDQISYIKEMVIDHKYKGELLPDNLVMVAVCNPYRIKQEKRTIKAGIKKEQDQKNTINLAFTVKPPPLSMIQFMWDYQQLREKQNQLYIGKILEEIEYQQQQKLVASIAYTHEFLKKNVEVSAVSLRDVSRFKELYNWFYTNMPTEPANQGLASIVQKKKDSEYNYKLPRKLRALVLSIAFCYSLRLASNIERNSYFQQVEKIMGFEPKFMTKVTKNQQIDYVNRLMNPGAKIALNFALRENVFTTLVCLMNKIPILIIGNPGSSKSLSIKMIASNFRGVNSASQFCKAFPEINMIFFQGSQSCTSKGIQAVFEKAIRSKEEFQTKKKQNKFKLQNCILFDQIGLAEKSVHNPLKVLHSKLQTNRKQIGFIGISNWQLDAAKMSRFLILARSTPDLQQLIETSVQIYKSYFPNAAQNDLTYFKHLAKYYSDFLIRWNQKEGNREGFFGLRDFYSYVKYACQVIGKEGATYEIYQKAKAKSIQINFDGQPGSLEIFNQIARVNSNLTKLTPIEIVEENLTSKQSRCLLLIVKGDALIPIINESIRKSHNGKRVVCIYGSTFKNDQQSQEYNLDMTSMIISHISRGNILAFKDINNSIQTSLYDLFNKSFYEVGEKKYCRIAVGANSNPKCYVHHEFNSMVYIDESKIKKTDLAFLNRFEKHYLNLQSMIQREQQELVKKIMRWIQNILSFRQATSPLKQENYIVNSCVESIVTLVIKYRGSKNIERDIKRTLLQNKTTDFQIALMEDKISEQYRDQINELIAQQQDFRKVREDLIIYTYDQFLDMAESYVLWSKKSEKLRISEMKCERDLRKQIERFFEQSDAQSLHIHLNYQSQSQHVNLVLYIATSMKQQFQSSKRIVLIIQLHRFSLITLGIDNINISYLHNLEQYFCQDLTTQGETKRLLEIRKMDEMFKVLQLEKSYNQMVLDTLKRFQFSSDYSQMQPELIQCYFYETTKVATHPLFQQKCLDFVIRHLKKKKIFFDILLTLNQDILVCSNIKEAIIRYMEQNVIVHLCHFFYRVLSHNLVYQFKPESLLQYYGDYQNLKILQEFLESSNIVYNEMLEKFLTQYVCAKDIDPNMNFQKGIESNPIKIYLPTIFPMSFKDIHLVYKGTGQKAKDAQNVQTVQLFGSKLFQCALSEQKKDESLYQMNLHKALSLFNDKSVMNCNLPAFKYQYWPSISNNQKNLGIGYTFDMLQYMFFEHEIQQQYVCKILNVLQWAFMEFNVQMKLTMLTVNRNFWARVFQTLIIAYHFENHVTVEEFLDKQLSIDNKNKRNLGEQMIRFANKILSMAGTFLQLKLGNVKHYGTWNYIRFFKEISVPIRKILTSYRQFGIVIDEQFLVSMKFIEVLEKIDKKNADKFIQHFVGKNVDNAMDSYPKKIFYYIKQLLPSVEQYKKIEILLNYLSLDIFPSWYQISVSAKNQRENIECFENFIDFSNFYPYFANNAVFFLEGLFNDYVDAKDYTGKLQAIHEFHKRGKIFETIESFLSFENHFSVALGNFISNKLKDDMLSIAQESKNKMTEEPNFLEKYWEAFLTELNKQPKSKLIQLFRIQFTKLYLVQYVQALVKKSQNKIMKNIDAEVQKDTLFLRHLRIYMMKNLYLQFKDMTIVRTDFYDNNACNWIKKCYDLIEEAQVEACLVPPPLSSTSTTRDLIDKLRQAKYIPTQIFTQIVQSALTSPQQMYEFLNFIMVDFYSHTVPKNLIEYYKNRFAERGDMRSPNFRVERQLVLRYMDHKLSDRFTYTTETTTEQFMYEQLPYLNLLNIMVANKKNETPFMEMFFTKQGKVPTDFDVWIGQRFIIGGRENAMVTLLETLIERNDQTAGYYKCSGACDYYYSVGGGRLGCQNVVHTSECPYCGGIIGGRQHGVLDRQSQGARKVTLQQLVPVCNEIRQRRALDIKQVTVVLFGYTNGTDQQSLKKCDIDNNRVPPITKRMLNMIIYMMWYFWIQFDFISGQEFNRLLNKTGNEGVKTVDLAMNFFIDKTKDSIQSKDKKDYLIWILGISKKIFQLMAKYKSTIKQSQRTSMSLIHCWHRDKCQRVFGNQIIKYAGGREKEKLILESRFLRAGFTMTKQDFVKEIGDFRIHTIQYPQMRMFKGVEQSKRPSYRNLLKQYGPTLPNQHPVLAFLMNNQENFNKCSYFKILYTFISKILKACHFKITRNYANVTSLNTFIKQNFSTDPHILTEMNQFIDAWNELSKSKYELRYGCHSHGFLEATSAEAPLRTFLPDNKHLDNKDGQILLALLQVSASEYNQLCKDFEDSIIKLRNDENYISILSLTVLNPTQVTKTSKMVEFPAQQLEQFVQSYSCFSVQYGIAVPHYALDEIESLVIKHFQGSKFILQDLKQYNIVNYVGELLHCITYIRQNHEQITLQKASTRQIINEYIAKHYTKNRDIFYKIMKNIQGSLENIMVYYKNSKPKKISISDFVHENKIRGLCKEVVEEPFQGLPMSTIVDLYETIEMSTFDQLAALLDPLYRAQKLTQQQEQKFNELKQKMKQNEDPENMDRNDYLPMYWDFRVALYRFVSRSLMLMQRDPKLILGHFILEGHELWPMDVDIYSFIDPQYRQTLNIPLKKTGHLLQLIPSPRVGEQMGKKIERAIMDAQFEMTNQQRIMQQYKFTKKQPTVPTNIMKRTSDRRTKRHV